MRLTFKKNKGMLILDLITSLIIIWFLIWVFGGIFFTLVRNTKETALRYQLNNFRMSVFLYKQLKGSNPKDLKVLVQSSHRFSGSDELIFGQKFLGSLEQDEHGAPLDVFGNYLSYDPKSGSINSTTKGYQNW
ncbi:MAG: hypothetical protein WCY09_06165 [Candidatus Omnitrophota bacterium]